MTDRSVDLRLSDMVEAIGLAREEVAGITLDAFESDRRRQLIVERCVEIISEASRHLPADVKARHPEIPWPRVAGIGNVLRHAYDRVAPDVLWALIAEHLPALERACRAELMRPD
ncbi:MAG: DUF86 domain-containing protein [Proteobacteria bacterium]|nr:DUF86 domain-containing protein [Pseudomonadota bacterium]